MGRASVGSMSSITPPSYDRWLAEPSMVIDPGLYQDVQRPHSGFGHRAMRATLLTVRTLACTAVVGVTLFSVAHADKWLARGHGSAHAAETRFVSEPTPVKRTALMGAISTPEARAPELAQAEGAEPQAAAAMAPVLKVESGRVPSAQGTLPTEVSGVASAEESLRDTLRAGRRALNQRKLDQAESAYQSVLADRKRHPGALAGMARVSLARGDLDEALRFAHLAVESAPSHAVYHLTLADVLRARAETAAADLEYEMAARLGQPVDRAAKALPENPF